jgi:KaiC/GvpD/RAD55 family RecA-like ATPase
MPEGSAPGPTAERRVSTGSPGLDTMLEGGLVPRRPYLVVGPSGTGKTTLALQFLIEGVRQGERCLFVTIEEPPNEMRVNHRGLGPQLDEVEVFDAIPDIMRYERVPFKDIASVRAVTPFKHVPLAIRRSPELSAVEVTMTALEQMLRTEVVRRGYSRLVVDSLTALQYFCMKGFDAVAGAQAFLRFLSDLHVTTILTVESPLEDVETPERMLARGEVRLFRWELDERSVRAVGVEKFRGSPHDVRLHPYRIGPQGIDVNLDVTISRDTRQLIEPARPVPAVPPTPTPLPLEEVISPVDPLAEQVRDLVVVGADLGPVRTEIEAALGAAAAGELDRSHAHLSRASALLIGLGDSLREGPSSGRPPEHEVAEAHQRIVQRGEAARAGLPPTKLPPPKVLEVQLEWVLSLIPPAPEVPAEAPTEAAPPVEPAPEPPSAPVEVPEPELVSPPPVEPVAVAPPETPPPAPPIPESVEPPEVAAPLPEPEPEPEPEVAPEPEMAPATEAESPAPSAPEPIPAAQPPTPPSVPAPSEPPPRAAPPPLRPWSVSTPPPPPPPMPASRPAPSLAPRPSQVPSPPPARSSVPPRESPGDRPPLPSLPAGPTSSAPGTPPPRAVAAVPVAPGVPRTAAAPAARAPVVAHAPEPPTVAEAPPPKRRRKAAATTRRKPAVVSVPQPPPAPVAPAPEVVATPAETPVPVPKPKRRAPRKRKAPSVVTATAGTIPPGVFGSAGERPDDSAPAREDEGRKGDP